MGFFGKEDPLADEIQRVPADQDVEKSVPAHQEKGQEQVQPPTMNVTALDPELERRVLRKLDWRVPTLMAFFCKPGLLSLTVYHNDKEDCVLTSPVRLDLLAFLDRSNIGFVQPTTGNEPA